MSDAPTAAPGSQDLFEVARDAAARAYAPYSDYPVGAALRTPSGAVHAGANMENASYPEGWCAETSALAHMVMSGETRFTEIAVFARKAARATPCGGCRQRLKEFAEADAKVHLCDAGGIVETVTIGDLLPAAFDL